MSKHIIEPSKVLLIARKEFVENITSKRFILVGGIYAFFAVLILLLMLMIYSGSEEAKAMIDPGTVFYLMDGLNFIMGLLAIIIASDAISSEKSQRTIYQLMSKPISRASVVAGKFLGAFGMVSVFFLVSVICVYLITSLFTMKFDIGEMPNVMAILFSMLMV
jgi:ABC-type transport system involved in multi-copper enzyme maturation permease subunit